MGDDLAARLMRLGLIDEADRLARPNASSDGAWLVSRAPHGLRCGAIVEVFERQGFGPKVSAGELDGAEPALIDALPLARWAALGAWPLRHTERGVEIAMAAPSDRTARDELAYVLGATLVPRVTAPDQLASRFLPDLEEGELALPLTRTKPRHPERQQTEKPAIHDVWDLPPPPPPASSADAHESEPPHSGGEPQERDEVIARGCKTALELGNAAVFFVLKDQMLRGRGSAGLESTGVQDLWIPTRSPSSFRTVVQSRRGYLGPYDGSVPDGLLRAAVGHRDGLLCLEPVQVRGKLVGVLAIDGVAEASVDVAQWAAEIAAEMGEGFESLLRRRS